MAGLEQNPGKSVLNLGFIFLSSLAKITLQFGCWDIITIFK